MTLLMIDWLSVGVKAGQFILSFSILVTLHELGHFIPAKLFVSADKSNLLPFSG